MNRSFDLRSAGLGAAVAVIASALLFATYVSWAPPAPSAAPRPSPEPQRLTDGAQQKAMGEAPTIPALQLSEKEFAQFKVQPVRAHDFVLRRDAIGSIDFNQEMSVQVFGPFAGRIISLQGKAGDDVEKGTVLFTIDSPDLVEAESKLVTAAGTLSVTTRNLERARTLFDVQGVSQKDLDQATADQQAAEGAVKAARDALRIFGKSDTDMDRIVRERKIDSVLVVHSPITGRITARNAAPGQFVQPGNPPAPFTVADISTMWMVANVPEADFSLLAVGQEVDVTVRAYPDRIFRGKIVHIGASVDPNTRRVEVRSEIRDPRHELRAGMFANFQIRTGRIQRSPAVPFGGVVREGDGTMTVWVATPERKLSKRTVTIGVQQDGLQQITAGLEVGESVATEGALFLSNALTAASR